METLIIVRDVILPVPYWSSGKDLKQARANFKKVSGRFPSKKAVVRAFKGKPELINKIMIDDMGSVSYPKGVVMVELQN